MVCSSGSSCSIFQKPSSSPGRTYGQVASVKMQDVWSKHTFLGDSSALHEWRVSDMRGLDVGVNNGEVAFMFDIVFAREVYGDGG